MANAQEIYDLCMYDLLEDGGLILGIVTVPQFIDALNLTLVDFIRETCPYKQIFTETIQAGVAMHDVPNSMMRVDLAFVGGRLIEQTTMDRISRATPNWRYELGMPRVWHADQIPIQKIEVAPAPHYNGTYIPGTAEPDPPHGQFGDFNITDFSGVLTPPEHGGLTMVGPQLMTPVAAITDPVPLIDDDFLLAYIGFGILERLFSGDNELKDPQRALFCRSQYEEGVNLLKSITCEPEEPA